MKSPALDDLKGKGPYERLYILNFIECKRSRDAAPFLCFSYFSASAFMRCCIAAISFIFP